MAQPHAKSDPESPPHMPRWVKLSVVIFIVLILIVVVLHLTGNSPFGPGGHILPASSSDNGHYRPWL